MKNKICAVVTLAVIPLLLTGCGSKKLVCTQKNDNIEMKYSFAFKKDKLNSIDYYYLIDFGAMGITEDQIKQNDLCETFVKSDENIKDAVKSCKLDIKDNKVTITSTLDAKKVKAESGITSDSKMEDVKSFYTGIGYECK